METILNNPGLQHLAENIFGNLNFEDLVVCREINQSSKRILDYQMDKPWSTLDKPMFLLRIFRSLSKKHQKDWIKVIESAKNSDKGKAISSYMQWNLKKEALVDLPSCRIIRFTSRMAFAPCWAFSYDASLPDNWRFQNHLYCL